MSKVCTLTGKKPRFGRSFTHRGIKKYLGGIGLKITGCTNRRFLPNLKKRKIWDVETGCFKSVRLSVAALRTVDKIGLSALERKAKSRAK